jgi:hypothetical protein
MISAMNHESVPDLMRAMGRAARAAATRSSPRTSVTCVKPRPTASRPLCSIG